VVTLLAGILAALAAVRLLRRRRAVREAPGADGPDPRAEELRRKLAGARDPGEPSASEPPASASPAPAVPSDEDADASRRRVHDEARETIDEMRRSGESA
jgi:hypothetical protein